MPLPAVPRVLDELAGAGYTGLVTDVTSVKGPVQMLVDQRLHRRHNRLASFVGGHPMAGRETSGFDASDEHLFHGCAWVLCIEAGVTQMPDWLTLAELVTEPGRAGGAGHGRGARPGRGRHLPRTASAGRRPRGLTADDPLAAALGAGSFRDGTRVAATRPELMAAMVGGNAAATRAALDAVRQALDDAKQGSRRPRPDHRPPPWFAPGYEARTGWPPQPGKPLDIPARPDALLRLGRAGGWVTAVAPDRQTVTVVRPAEPPERR